MCYIITFYVQKRENIYDIEEGNLLSPKFDNDGLIPVITMCSKTKDILMHGYMNVEVLKRQLKLKRHIILVDREKLFGIKVNKWIYSKVTEIRIDDDQDSIWLTVDIGDGASCHVGYRSCFYRSIPMGQIENGRKVEMKFLEKEKNLILKKFIRDNLIQLKFNYGLANFKTIRSISFEAKIPEKIVNDINNYIEELIQNKKSEEADHGKKLAGDVTQEFLLDPDFVKRLVG